MFIQHNAPACPMSRKNHTLPVTFSSRGMAYAGFLNRSYIALTNPEIFCRSQDAFGSESSACLEEGFSSLEIAALFTANMYQQIFRVLCSVILARSVLTLMKGVVRPQAIPTKRNPAIQRQIGGDSS